MEFFRNGDTVRLRSHCNRFLFAEDNQQSVRQDKSRLSNRARWTVEHVPGSDSVIRLKSNCNKYLTASDEPFLRVFSRAQKVLQTLTLPEGSETAVQWEPIKHGTHIRLKSCSGQRFLRGCGALRAAPWRYSVNHYPAEDETEKSSLDWDVEIDVENTTPAADPAARRRDNMARVQMGIGAAGVVTGVASTAALAANLAANVA